MSATEWISAASTLVVLALLAVVAVDRNRLKQRLSNAEGALTGLGLDLAATTARVDELQSYLGRHGSWAVDAPAPAALADPRPVDRWTSGSPDPDTDEHARESEPVGRQPADPSA